jgi:arylsulfatase A-like enzyme
VRSLAPLTQSQIDAWRNERIAAQRALLGVDDGVQRIVAALKARGDLDNTLLIFMSDNGYSFGSHRYIDKFCVYEECSHVPFLVRHPDLSTNRSDNRFISNVDVAATISEFAGVTPGRRQDGHSLLPLVTNPAGSWPNELLLERLTGSTRQFYGIRVPGWTYAEYTNGDKELYDLSRDPYQLTNLANAPAHAAQQQYLAQRLQALKSGTG